MSSLQDRAALKPHEVTHPAPAADSARSPLQLVRQHALLEPGRWQLRLKLISDGSESKSSALTVELPYAAGKMKLF